MNTEKIKTYLKINLCFSIIAFLGFLFCIINSCVKHSSENNSDFYNILVSCLVIYFIGYLVNFIYSIVLYVKYKVTIQPIKSLLLTI